MTVRATITVAEKNKILHLETDLVSEMRNILTRLADFFVPKYFLGKQVPVLVNLTTRKIKGIESQGMILTVDVDGHILSIMSSLVASFDEVQIGSRLLFHKPNGTNLIASATFKR